MGNVNTVPSNTDEYSLNFISFEADDKVNARKPVMVKGGKLPRVSKAENTVTIEKDGNYIRCKMVADKKLKKLSTVKKSDKEKISVIKRLFAKKYDREQGKERA